MKKPTCFLPIILILSLWNCSTENEVPEHEKKIIAEEIQDRLNGYPEALKNKDIDWFRNFWSDEPGFAFAGDGDIVTDYESFIQELEDLLSNQEEVLHFEFGNDHINVFSQDLASYVVHFDWGMVSHTGDTIRSKGSWLYVFEKSDDQWRVVHSAGTHNFY